MGGGEVGGGGLSLLLNFQKGAAWHDLYFERGVAEKEGVTFLGEVAIFLDKPIYRGELPKKGGLDIFQI